MKTILHLMTLAVTAGSLSAEAAVIDFESVNGATPVEGTVISNQFAAHFGVSFRLGNGEYPVIGKVGIPQAGWRNDSLDTYDTLHPNDPRANDFGQFFLSDDGIVGTRRTLILDFASPVSTASGYMIDIDGNEAMTVTAYSDDGVTILSEFEVSAGDPETGGGRSTPWSFTRPSPDITQIRLRYSGGSGDANIAFDSFASSYTPPVQTAASLGISMFSGVTIQGDAGRPYQIEYSDDPAGANWVALTNVFLPASTALFFDSSSTNRIERSYRAISLQTTVLDFESMSGATPVEGMYISNQFAAHFGVSFRLGNGGYPLIGKMGVPRACWVIDSLNPAVYDTLHPSDPRLNQFGQFFLSDDGIQGTQRTLILDFASPVASASGYMFDVDGNEQMTITAYSDDGTNVLSQIIVNPGDPNTGEGRSTPWSIIRPAPDITQIRLRHTGTTGAPNIGFDSFVSSYTPSAQTTASLAIFTFAGITIDGDTGRPYHIEHGDSLGSSNWVTLTNVFLPSSKALFFDPSSTNGTTWFYRATSFP